MMSSEIVRHGWRPGVRPSQGAKKRSYKVNPQPLQPSDTLSLTNLDISSNTGSAGSLTSTSVPAAMMPLGSERPERLRNSGTRAELTTKAPVTKYANPPATDFQGQSWTIS